MKKNHLLLGAWVMCALGFGIAVIASHDPRDERRGSSDERGDARGSSASLRPGERGRDGRKAPGEGEGDDASARARDDRPDAEGDGVSPLSSGARRNRGLADPAALAKRSARAVGADQGGGERSRDRIPPGLRGISAVDAKAESPGSGDDLADKKGHITGRLASATTSTITGYAFDWTDLESVVLVDIFVDSNLVATVPASETRPRNPTVKAPDAAFDHVFSAATPPSANDGDKHWVVALAWKPGSDARTPLDGSPRTFGGLQPPYGKLLWASSTLVYGWAQDPNAPGQPLTIQIVGDGVVLGTTQTLGAGHNGDVFAQALALAPTQKQTQTLDVSGPDDPNLAAVLAARCQTIARASRYVDMRPLVQAGPGQAWDELDFVASPLGATSTVPLSQAATAAIKFSQPDDDVQAFLFAPTQPITASWVQVLVQSVDGSITRQAKRSPMQIGDGGNQMPTGGLTTVNAAQVAGWAADADVLPNPIDVDVFIDGTFVQRVTANQSFPGLLFYSPPLPDPNHGFVFAPPDRYRDGKAHLVQVYAINQPEGINFEVYGSPASFVGLRNQPPTGCLDGATTTSTGGWAYDPDAGATPISVEIWMDGSFVSTVVANSVREDLVPIFAPEATHGFTADLPPAAADGKQHIVRAYAINVPDGPKQELPGSPRTIGARAAYLGIVARDQSAGLTIASVVSGSPASLAGLSVGDVIRAYDDQSVDVNANAFNQWLITKQAGDSAVFRLFRDPALVPAPPPASGSAPPSGSTTPGPNERIVAVTLVAPG